ncbi:bifunctional diguanylate cyclase/phosphodiesterase [Mycobacterium sp. NPDC006124]|uniref:putative bifunctional diguanylate cyclase/phosphodiesterase n=1 Tax=Mycobacterium sp. NPDC006124 TaxID=3156729 RepID=UPI0033AFEBC4
MTTTPRTRRWQVVVLGTAGALVLVNATARWSDATTVLVDNAMQLSAGTAATLCALICGLRETGARRRWRLLVATGMAAWTMGLSLWAWYQIVDGEGLPSPSLADAGFLLYVPFGLAALFTIAGAARSGDDTADTRARNPTAGLMLDGLIVTTSLFFLSWLGALGPVVSAGAPNRVTLIVAVAYPVTDLIMVSVAVLAVVFGRVLESDRVGFLFLTAGIVALALSDSVYAYLVAVNATTMKPLENAGYVFGPLLIAFAALERASGSTKAVRPVGHSDGWALGLPYAALFAVGLIVANRLLTGPPLGVVATTTGLLVVSLVVARQLLTVLQNRRLLDRVYADQRLLLHLAYHDSLTGLANRLSFARRLDDAIARRRALALILVDVDDFKEVNDRFGHPAGDRVLHEVGRRLQEVAEASNTVARIGGDEFAILVEGTAVTATDLVGRIRAALRTPVLVDEVPVSLRVSMGVVLPDLDEPFLDGDVLLGRADVSMYAGKRTGKDAVVVYRPAMGDAPDFTSALRSALGDRPIGFCMVYQPVVRLDDDTVVALEALARWKASDGSDVEPGLFVPSAEHAGLGRVLDVMVVNAVCAEIADLPARLTVHVNVGAARLGDEEFEAAVSEALATHRTPPGRLVFEITETEAVKNVGDAAAAIRRLQDMGIRVALDDFGTGYNSLRYLHELPVNVIKLDRSLTAWVATDATLYRSLIGICDGLGLDVIAEGIETEESADTVRRLGCRYGQGFFFGRPDALSAVVDGLSRERHAAGRRVD